MSNVLRDLILEGKLDLYLSEQEKEKLIQKLNGIKKNYLYKSDFHGLHHSEKVFLFSYLLGRHEGLTEEELEILTDAALYHDVGRRDESEDEIHGYTATLRLPEIVRGKTLYQNEENLEILKAICDVHSVRDSRMEQVLSNYEISEGKKEILLKLAKLLKDADAIDRTRFRKTSVAALKTCFLRFDYSRELVSLAYKVNDYYREQICERNFETYSKANVGELTLCLHGIGFNFAALDGILDYGILSEYAKKKKGVNASRNFKGNNGEMWISVCQGAGEAKKLFVDNGIYFECLAPHLIKGEKVSSVATSKGLPIDSGRYSDERFAFFEIPLENILSININPELLDKDVSELYYLNSSSNYETLENNINYYLNYLRIKLDYFPDISVIEKLKVEFRNAILEYERLDNDSQKKEQSNFLNETDQIKLKINAEIAKMFKEAFSKKFGKENVTVFDVVTDIINAKKIDYTYQDGTFKFGSREKKI